MKARDILLIMATKEDLLTACDLRRNHSLLFARSFSHDKSDLPMGIALCEDIDADYLLQALKNKI